MSTEASRSYDRGYADGGEQARDEIVDYVFGILADARENAVIGYSAVWAVDYLSTRLDAYIDLNRGVWANA
jgi:hypothetical protein